MKYAIYGISCCGKDTFIKMLLNSGKFPGYEHPKGSETLNLIARDHFGKAFRELSSEDKDFVRTKYAEDVSQKKDIFADGHFCFPKDGRYEVVFTDSDAHCYDAFFYLKAKPELVKERITASEKNQKFASLSVEDIAAWQNTLSAVSFPIHSVLLTPSFTEQLTPLISRFAAGQMDVKTLLQKLNDTARMVEYELQ